MSKGQEQAPSKLINLNKLPFGSPFVWSLWKERFSLQGPVHIQRNVGFRTPGSFFFRFAGRDQPMAVQELQDMQLRCFHPAQWRLQPHDLQLAKQMLFRIPNPGCLFQTNTCSLVLSWRLKRVYCLSVWFLLHFNLFFFPCRG